MIAVVYLLSVAAATAVFLAVLWGLVYVVWQPRWYATDPLDVDASPLPDLDTERRELKRDLEERMVPRPRARPDDPPLPNETLLNQGIAENHTVSEDDTELPGDSWLCDGRPLWFALFQFVFGVPVAVVFAALINLGLNLFPSVVFGTLAAQACVLVGLVWVSNVKVRERTRLGVKRFGSQKSGFLHDGLQFLLPWFEEGDVIPFLNLVWGPQAGERRLGDEIRLNGSLGGSNPEPGLINVALLGRWQVQFTLAITLRVRQHSKRAWYDVLNRYRNIDEIGERIAAVATAVLFTRVREVRERVTQRIAAEAARTGTPPRDIENEPRGAVEVYLEFLNEVPEVSGSILLALHDLGQERLGGILPLGVTTAIAHPDEAFQELLRVEDRAKAERYRQMIEGQAVAHRLRQIHAALADLYPDEATQEQFMSLLRMEVQRLFAQTGAQEGTVEALLKAWLAQLVQRGATPPT